VKDIVRQSGRAVRKNAGKAVTAKPRAWAAAWVIAHEIKSAVNHQSNLRLVDEELQGGQASDIEQRLGERGGNYP